jgi:hypothetical protein
MPLAQALAGVDIRPQSDPPAGSRAQAALDPAVPLPVGQGGHGHWQATGASGQPVGRTRQGSSRARLRALGVRRRVEPPQPREPLRGPRGGPCGRHTPCLRPGLGHLRGALARLGPRVETLEQDGRRRAWRIAGDGPLQARGTPHAPHPVPRARPLGARPLEVARDALPHEAHPGVPRFGRRVGRLPHAGARGGHALPRRALLRRPCRGGRLAETPRGCLELWCLAQGRLPRALPRAGDETLGGCDRLRWARCPCRRLACPLEPWLPRGVQGRAGALQGVRGGQTACSGRGLQHRHPLRSDQGLQGSPCATPPYRGAVSARPAPPPSPPATGLATRAGRQAASTASTAPQAAPPGRPVARRSQGIRRGTGGGEPRGDGRQACPGASRGPPGCAPHRARLAGPPGPSWAWTPRLVRARLQRASAPARGPGSAGVVQEPLPRPPRGPTPCQVAAVGPPMRPHGEAQRRRDEGAQPAMQPPLARTDVPAEADHPWRRLSRRPWSGAGGPPDVPSGRRLPPLPAPRLGRARLMEAPGEPLPGGCAPQPAPPSAETRMGSWWLLPPRRIGSPGAPQGTQRQALRPSFLGARPATPRAAEPTPPLLQASCRSAARHAAAGHHPVAALAVLLLTHHAPRGRPSPGHGPLHQGVVARALRRGRCLAGGARAGQPPALGVSAERADFASPVLLGPAGAQALGPSGRRGWRRWRPRSRATACRRGWRGSRGRGSQRGGAEAGRLVRRGWGQSPGGGGRGLGRAGEASRGCDLARVPPRGAPSPSRTAASDRRRWLETTGCLRRRLPGSSLQSTESARVRAGAASPQAAPPSRRPAGPPAEPPAPGPSPTVALQPSSTAPPWCRPRTASPPPGGRGPSGGAHAPEAARVRRPPPGPRAATGRAS